MPTATRVLLSATERPGVCAAGPGRTLALRASILLRLGQRSAGRSGHRTRRRRVSAAVAIGRCVARRVDRLIDWIPTWYRFLERRWKAISRRRPTAAYSRCPRAGMDGMFYGKGHFRMRARRGRHRRVPTARVPVLVVPGHEYVLGEPGVRCPADLAEWNQARLDPDGVFRGVISIIRSRRARTGSTRSDTLQGSICARVLYPRERRRSRCAS